MRYFSPFCSSFWVRKGDVTDEVLSGKQYFCIPVSSWEISRESIFLRPFCANSVILESSHSRASPLGTCSPLYWPSQINLCPNLWLKDFMLNHKIEGCYLSKLREGKLQIINFSIMIIYLACHGSRAGNQITGRQTLPPGVQERMQSHNHFLTALHSVACSKQGTGRSASELKESCSKFPWGVGKRDW